jgi:protocatechuate 3,4-dioxygenase alpha subunit
VNCSAATACASPASAAWPQPATADAPYIAVGVFARGLLHHLYTRIYLPGTADDALLSALPAERRGTLRAHEDGTVAAGRAYRFDIRMQGDESEETVFLAFA